MAEAEQGSRPQQRINFPSSFNSPRNSATTWFTPSDLDDTTLKRKRGERQPSHASRTPRTDHSSTAASHSEHNGPPNPPSTRSPLQPHLQINYLARQQSTDLSLLDPSLDTLPTCVNLLKQYTSALERSESLANNLGARPLSSILLQRFERMFDGPPQVLERPANTPNQSVLSWLDVAHASNQPADINVLDDPATGKRVVRLRVNEYLVQISWEEWQMVRSGLLQSMMPAQHVAEDEEKELGTLDILEDTVARVVALSDQVAARGRQFNHRLAARRSAIQEGRQGASASNQTKTELHRLFTTNRKHVTPDLKPSLQPSMTSPNRVHNTMRINGDTSYVSQPTISTPSAQSTVTPASTSATRPRRPPGPPAPEGPYKATMTSRMEMLPKGARIYPPCDRCRRLRIDCQKNLTACVGCTKKHCKCAWRDVSEEEVVKGALISQSNGMVSGLGEMGAEVDYAGVEMPTEVGEDLRRHEGGEQSRSGSGEHSPSGDAEAQRSAAESSSGGLYGSATRPSVTPPGFGQHNVGRPPDAAAQVDGGEMRAHA